MARKTTARLLDAGDPFPRPEPGRLDWQDVLGFVEYHRAHSSPRGRSA